MTLRLLRLIPFVLLALVIAFAPWPTIGGGREVFLRVEAGDFAFSPAVLRVNPGDIVTIELASTDVAHGLSIDGYPVDLHAEPGQPQRATFTAGRAGRFVLRCSLACGALHPFMTGRFEVGPNLLLYRAAGLVLLAAIAGLWRPWK